jgi:hypothetical protein
MSTVPDIPGPYRLSFYSFDCHEPPHVHVCLERMVCKFWLTPVALGANHGFSPRELNGIRPLVVENLGVSWRHGMTAVANNDPRILTVEVTDDLITTHLADGRTISVPLAWSWRLSDATPEQRQHFEIIGTGQGVHWPDIDEDISAMGTLTGTPAPRP